MTLIIFGRAIKEFGFDLNFIGFEFESDVQRGSVWRVPTTKTKLSSDYNSYYREFVLCSFATVCIRKENIAGLTTCLLTYSHEQIYM